jgi:hypothetical protein
MKQSYRKIVAREFLLFMLSSCVLFIVYLSLILFNLNIERKATKFDKAIEKEIIERKQIDSTYSRKCQNWAYLYNKVNEQIDLENSNYNHPTKFWKRTGELIKKDSFDYKYQKEPVLRLVFKNAGLLSKEDVKKFVKENNLNEIDKANIQKTTNSKTKENELRKELEITKKSHLNNDDKAHNLYIAFVIIFLLVFPIRYLYYAILWSFKTLKEK